MTGNLALFYIIIIILNNKLLNPENQIKVVISTQEEEYEVNSDLVLQIIKTSHRFQKG